MLRRLDDSPAARFEQDLAYRQRAEPTQTTVYQMRFNGFGGLEYFYAQYLWRGPFQHFAKVVVPIVQIDDLT